LITDGRFSGGTSGLSIGHVSPEAAATGLLALVEDGDKIEIDISSRKIHLQLSDADIEQRRQQMEQSPTAYQAKRERQVSLALQAYALMATSADRGAVRDISQVTSVK